MATKMMMAPTRSLEQRRDALLQANAIRSERAGFKRDLRAAGAEEARWIAGRLLEAPPWWAESWVVWDLLLGLPKFGRVKVSKLLHRIGISQRRRVGGLSARQRRELQEALVGPLRQDMPA